MVPWKQSLRLIPLSLLLGIFLMTAALALGRFIVLQNREPADYLPAQRVTLLLKSRGERGRLSSFLLEGRSLPTVPQELRSFVSRERTIAALSQSGTVSFSLFVRVLPSKEARERVQAFTLRRGGESAVVGPYLVLGREIVPSLLTPGSALNLSHDAPYRTALAHASRAATETLYLRREGADASLLPLPPLFEGTIAETPWAFFFSEEQGERVSLSLVLPSVASQAHRFSPFFPLLSRMPLLFFGVSGTDPAGELKQLLQFLAPHDPDRVLILRGALQAFMAKTFGGTLDAWNLLQDMQHDPYTLLVRGGSEGTFSWVFGWEQQGRGEYPQKLFTALEEGFSSQGSEAMLRRRELPNGKGMRDIVADPTVLERTKETYRGYASVLLRHRTSGATFVRAEKGSTSLLSNDRAFLHSVIDALGDVALLGGSVNVPQGATHLLSLSGAVLARTTPLLGESAFFQSLHSFVSEAERVQWVEGARGSVTRHTFLLEYSKNH